MTIVKQNFITIIICLVLIFTAGIADGIRDSVSFKYSLTVFPQNDTETYLGQDKNWWKPQDSWKNKWKLDEGGKLIPVNGTWYYFGLHKPKYKERFAYSSTGLVFLTDAWHTCQFIVLTLYTIAVLIAFRAKHTEIVWWEYIIVFVVLKVALSVGFSLTYV